jgi:hypothetical protein
MNQGKYHHLVPAAEMAGFHQAHHTLMPMQIADYGRGLRVETADGSHKIAVEGDEIRITDLERKHRQGITEDGLRGARVPFRVP